MAIENVLEIFLLQQRLKAQEKKEASETARMMYLSRSDQQFKRDQLSLSNELKQEENSINILSDQIRTLQGQEFDLQNALTATGYFKEIDKTGDNVKDIVGDISGGIEQQLKFLSGTKTNLQESISGLRKDLSDINNVIATKQHAAKEFPKIAAISAGEFEIDTPAEVAALKASFPGGMPDRFSIYSDDYKLSDAEIFQMGRPIYDTKEAIEVKTASVQLTTQINVHAEQKVNLKTAKQKLEQGKETFNTTQQAAAEQQLQRILQTDLALDKDQLEKLGISMENSKTIINRGLLTSIGDFSVWIGEVPGLAPEDARLSIHDYLKTKESKSNHEANLVAAGKNSDQVMEDKTFQYLDLKITAFELALQDKFGEERALEEYDYNIGDDIIRAVDSLTGESPNWAPWSQLMERFISEYSRKKEEQGANFTQDWEYDNTVLGHAGFLTDPVQRNAMATLTLAYENLHRAEDESQNITSKKYENPLTDESKIVKSLVKIGGPVEEAEKDLSFYKDLYGASLGPPQKPAPPILTKEEQKIADEEKIAANKLSTFIAERKAAEKKDWAVGLGIGAGAVVATSTYTFTIGQFDKALMEMVDKAGKNWTWKEPGSKILSAAEFKKEFGAGTKLSGSALKKLLSEMHPQELEKWLSKTHNAELWNKTTIGRFFKSLSGTPKGFVKYVAKGMGMVPYILPSIGKNIDAWMYGPEGKPEGRFGLEQAGQVGFLGVQARKTLRNNPRKYAAFLRFVKKRFPIAAKNMATKYAAVQSAKVAPNPWIKGAGYAMDLGFSIAIMKDLWDEFSGKDVETALEDAKKQAGGTP